MPRGRVPIRAKVAGSLALPLVALVVVSGLEVRQAAADTAEVRRETRLARSVTGPTGVITRLQDERTWAVLELTGLSSSYEVPMAGYDETRAATDAALEAFQTDVADAGGAVEATYGDAAGIGGELAAIRRDIDGSTGPRTLDNMGYSSRIYDRYSALVGGLLDASTRISGQVSDAELRQGTELAVLVSNQIETQANLSRRTVTAATLSPGGLDTAEELTAVAGRLAAFDRHNRQIHRTATGPYAAIVDEHYPDELAEQLRDTVTTIIDEGTLEDFSAFMDVIGVPSSDDYPALRDAAIGEVTRRADLLNDRAADRQRLFVAMAVAALAVAVPLAWWVSRTITGSLRSLDRQAHDVAERRLPGAVRHILATPPGQDVHLAPAHPVQIGTRDEIADVATALNSMQDSALSLATEQAVLQRNIAESFVHLGRRNQNLLGRQLDFITELESNETDPDALAGLFQLDHLATRMRRNAESLLVLAGIEPSRTWAAPVPVGDVIRAALGEVEGYERVRFDGIEPVMVRGAAVADLTHLLAELVENALAFSPLTTGVTVRGGRHSNGGYQLTILDHGIGIAGPDLQRANARLAGTESMTVAPSSYLGHYVTGTLAARHHIQVQLEPAPDQGTTARIRLPADLVDAPPGDRSGRSAGPDSAPAATVLQRTARTGTFE